MNDERTVRWMSIHPQETFLVKRLDELIEKAAQGAFRLSFFVDPRGRALARARARSQGVSVFAYGGYEGAERARLLFAPEDAVGETSSWYENRETMALGFVKIHVKEGSITHRQVLGAILSLGVKREMLGDIVLPLQANCAILVTSDALAPFIADHLQSIDRASVRAEVVTHVSPECFDHAVRGDVRVLFTSSLRLDGVLKDALHLSRERAKLLIQKGAVRVSFRPVDAPDFPVAPGDILSVRGYGRIYIDEVVGQSKKGRYRLHVRLLLDP
ncbi:MAG: YlmH/Sll1252 family protein [Candidatus Carbobacillus sp.]|nr:YlmH/Sll1252 family protein [Candidatus Carbobacillus sp.]